MLELIINKNEDLENIILLQNGKIIEYYTSTEEDRKRRLEGNTNKNKKQKHNNNISRSTYMAILYEN